MNEPDRLRDLMVEFFELPEHTEVASLIQRDIANWDSFAMVHLITELQNSFGIEFDVTEIDQLTSYESIKQILSRKGIEIRSSP